MSDDDAAVRKGGVGNPPLPPAAVREVRVVGFNMPFLNLVGFFVKAAVAAIPAVIIIAVVYAVIATVFAGLIGGMAMKHV